MQFTPTEDFYDDDLRSAYCKGLTYTVRDYYATDKSGKKVLVKAADSLLAMKVKAWLESGKVRISDGLTAENALGAGGGQVRGEGTVTD